MSSLNSIVSQYAATDPAVAAAVNTQQADSAILAGMASGDPGTSSLLASVFNQGTEINTLLNSASALTSSIQSGGSALGGHLDVNV